MDYGSEEGTFDLCHGCRNPIDDDDKKSTRKDGGADDEGDNEQKGASKQRKSSLYGKWANKDISNSAHLFILRAVRQTFLLCCLHYWYCGIFSEKCFERYNNYK